MLNKCFWNYFDQICLTNGYSDKSDDTLYASGSIILKGILNTIPPVSGFINSQLLPMLKSILKPSVIYRIRNQEIKMTIMMMTMDWLLSCHCRSWEHYSLVEACLLAGTQTRKSEYKYNQCLNSSSCALQEK